MRAGKSPALFDSTQQPTIYRLEHVENGVEENAGNNTCDDGVDDDGNGVCLAGFAVICLPTTVALDVMEHLWA